MADAVGFAVSPAAADDLSEVVRLALLLWPDAGEKALADEMASYIGSARARLFLAREGASAVGFAQCQLRRDYVEGTSTSPVGYLEGVFVEDPSRRRGAARALLSACEEWASACGCREFASDCELGNEGSRAFHLASGFQEANRIICFRKDIGAQPPAKR